MWVAPKLGHLIHDSGQSRLGSALWIRLRGVPGQDVRILNVYAPHTSTERCNFWLELLAILPRDCRWVFSGDWNFVKDCMAKSSRRAPSTSGMEKRVFSELKATFQVTDSFPASNRIRYSSDVGGETATEFSRDWTEFTPSKGERRRRHTRITEF